MVAATNLWPEASRFIGRAQALESLEAAVAESRLVSVLGPPGIGKTRLARQLGVQLAQRGGREVWFVDLTTIHEPDRVLGAIARALGINLRPGRGSSADDLAEALRERGPSLIILDNFEQLVGPAAALVEGLVRGAPQIHWVVTSREALRIDGEQRYELEALSPEEAEQLFLVRARQIEPTFRLSAEDAAVIRRVVARLDHLPLAIELAAARVGVLSPVDLERRLDQRLTLLKADRPGLPARLSTLRGAIDWSWALLDEPEQRALCQCAVFQGGFTLAAAEVVLAGGPVPVVDLLESLRRKSLLLRLGQGADVRFGLLESIREYAANAGASDHLRFAEAERRHRAHYLGWAEERRGRAAQPEVQDELGPELDNLVHAVRGGLAESDPLALSAVEVLDELLGSRGPFDLREQLLKEAVQIADRLVEPERRARTRLRLAEALRIRGDLEGSQVVLQTALDLPISPLTRAELLELRARIYVMQDRAPEAIVAFEEELAILRAAETERDRLAAAQVSYAGALHELGALEEAAANYAAAELRIGTQPTPLAGRFWYSRAVLRLEQRDPGWVMDLEHALAVSARLRSVRLHGLSRVLRGVGALQEGRLREVEEDLQAGLQKMIVTRDSRLSAFGRMWLAAFWALTGRLDEARGTFEDLTRATQAEADRIMIAANTLLSRVWLLAQARAEHTPPPPPLLPASTHEAIDVRWARRFVARLEAPEDGDPAWPVWVRGDGQGLRTTQGDWVELGRRPSLAAILQALAEGHRRDPDGAFTGPELLAIGWPGEKVLPEAGQARVYVALSTLRKLGLGDRLESGDRGYRLSPRGVWVSPPF